MSSIVNKVKDVLHSDKDKHSTTHDNTTTANTRLNEPRVDAEHDNRTSALNAGTAGNTAYASNDNYATGATHSHATGPASTTAGPHSSNVANKADPRVDSDLDSRNRVGGVDATNTHATGPASNTAGPHSSNIANKADPRVDSDLDSRNRVGGTGNTSGFTTGHATTTGHTTGPHSSNLATGPASSTAGPHSSNLANKADPRVDSDLDSGRTGYNTRSSAAATGAPVSSHSAVHGQNYNTNTVGDNAGLVGATGSSGLNTATGHSSGLTGATGNSGLNTTTGTVGAGYGTGNTVGTQGVTGTHGAHNTTGVHGTHGTTGVHDTTGVHGTTGPHGTATGSSFTNPGPAPNTAGPHKSDMLNKVDPRVDSNLDGSKTVGGNNTLENTRKDPTDASQVPPSVLQKHVGPPTIEHDDATHDRERRHSIHKREAHHGL